MKVDFLDNKKHSNKKLGPDEDQAISWLKPKNKSDIHSQQVKQKIWQIFFNFFKKISFNEKNIIF